MRLDLVFKAMMLSSICFFKDTVYATKINKTIDLNKMDTISVLAYSTNFNNIQLTPTFVSNYIEGNTIEDDQLIADSTPNLFSLGSSLSFNTTNLLLGDGQKKWAYSLDSYTYSSPTIANNGDIYMFSSIGTLYAILPNGTVKWIYKQSAQKFSSILAINEILFFSGEDGCVYSVNATSGVERCNICLTSFCGSSCSYNLTTPSAALNGDTIYVGGYFSVGSNSSMIYAIYPSCALKWQRQLSNTFSTVSCPSITADTLYTTCGNSVLYAIDLNNGSIKWKFLIGISKSLYTTVAQDGTIYINSNINGANKGVYAINSDGSLKWTYLVNGTAGTLSPPAVANNNIIYFGTNLDVSVYALFANGSLKWKYLFTNSCGSNISALAIGADGTIYGGATHCIFALYPHGNLRWSKEINGWTWLSPAISKNGVVYMPICGSQTSNFSGKLLAISTKNFVNEDPWPCLLQNAARVSLPKNYNLKLYDFKTLVLSGEESIVNNIDFEVLNTTIRFFLKKIHLTENQAETQELSDTDANRKIQHPVLFFSKTATLTSTATITKTIDIISNQFKPTLKPTPVILPSPPPPHIDHNPENLTTLEKNIIIGCLSGFGGCILIMSVISIFLYKTKDNLLNRIIINQLSSRVNRNATNSVNVTAIHSGDDRHQTEPLPALDGLESSPQTEMEAERDTKTSNKSSYRSASFHREFERGSEYGSASFHREFERSSDMEISTEPVTRLPQDIEKSYISIVDTSKAYHRPSPC